MKQFADGPARRVSEPTAVPLPGCDVSPQRDMVCSLLRKREARWTVEREAVIQQIPLGDIDEQAWNAVRGTVSRGEKTAIIVPRVQPGLSIGPTISLAVGAMLQKANRLRPSDVIPLAPGERIALVGRMHVTRHLFAESVLRFNQTPTWLCAFPTARVDRKGRCDYRLYGRVLREHRQRPIEENVEIVIYDLAPFADSAPLPSVQVVLAELYEHDAIDTVERLEAFSRLSDARAVIAFASAFDQTRLEQLKDAGFRLLPLREFHYAGTEPLPSLTGTSRAAPMNTRYEAHVVPSASNASIALAKAHFLLAQCLEVCKGEQAPAFLRSAWFVLDALSAMAAPLQSYDRARRQTGRPTLITEIERLRTPRVLHGEQRVAEIVFVGWTNVVDALQSAYDLLITENPLAELALERIIDESSALVVAVPDRASRDAILGELVIGYGWRNDSIRIDTVANLSRDRMVARNIVSLGIDGTHRKDAALWSMLPERVEAFVYPHAVRRHARWVDRCNDLLRVRLSEDAIASARHLWGCDAVIPTARSMGEIVAHLEIPDLSDVRARLREEEQRSWSIVPATGVHSAAQERDEDLLFEDPDDDFTSTEVCENRYQLSLLFTNGEKMVFDANAEVLAIDGEDVERRSVSLLRAGDEILFLPEDRHRSAFETIRERTSHLIGADERVLERWRQSLSLLRYKYLPSDPYAVRRFVDDAVADGCDKGVGAIASWLKGLFMAPRDLEDIELLVRMSGLGAGADVLARQVHAEVTSIRSFCRSLGYRFQQRLEGKALPAEDPVVAAIDDFLDEAEHRTVVSVEPAGPLFL